MTLGFEFLIYFTSMSEEIKMALSQLLETPENYDPSGAPLWALSHHERCRTCSNSRGELLLLVVPFSTFSWRLSGESFANFLRNGLTVLSLRGSVSANTRTALRRRAIDKMTRGSPAPL